MRRFTWILTALIIIAGAAAFAYARVHNKRALVYDVQQSLQQDIAKVKPQQQNQEDKALPQKVLLSVPFTSQAPFAEWSDPQYDSACEEANTLMAYYWATGHTEEKIPPQEAKNKIADEIAFEEKNYNFSYDTSAEDTVKWASAYFNFNGFRLERDVNVEEIKKQLAAGNLVLGFMNGQKLGNPYYSGAGPAMHVLLFKGYDLSTGQFITNDSGTRNGENFKYSFATIDSALRDYPTGQNEPITSIHKDIIVVTKQ